MKKISILFAFIMIAGMTCNAQLFKFGISAGLGDQAPIFEGSLNDKAPVRAGATAEFILPIIGLGVEGSLLYENSPLMYANTSMFTDRYSFLKIPVAVKWRIGIPLVKVFLTLGPYYSMSWDKDLKNSVNEDSFSFFGLETSVGAEILNKIHVRIGYNYPLFSDTQKVVYDRNSSIFLGLGYWF